MVDAEIKEHLGSKKWENKYIEEKARWEAEKRELVEQIEAKKREFAKLQAQYEAQLGELSQTTSSTINELKELAKTLCKNSGVLIDGLSSISKQSQVGTELAEAVGNIVSAVEKINANSAFDEEIKSEIRLSSGSIQSSAKGFGEEEVKAINVLLDKEHGDSNKGSGQANEFSSPKRKGDSGKKADKPRASAMCIHCKIAFPKDEVENIECGHMIGRGCLKK